MGQTRATEKLAKLPAMLLVWGAVCLSQPALANDVPLTPEQQAFFPKEDHLDQKLWDIFNNARSGPQNAITASQVRKLRYHQAFRWGYYAGVCLAWHQNQELWGGELVGGCTTLKLHRGLKNAAQFRFPQWRDVNPRDHIDIIRKSFLAAEGNNMRSIEEQSSDPLKYRHSSNSGAYWELMAPIIKRMLEHGNVRMAEALFDVNNSGKPEHVYAVTLVPKSICLQQDGTYGSESYFLYVDSTSPEAVSFNKRQVSGEPFQYAGITYFAGNNIVSNVAPREPGTNRPETTFWIQCEFEETKR